MIQKTCLLSNVIITKVHSRLYNTNYIRGCTSNVNEQTEKIKTKKKKPKLNHKEIKKRR